MSHVEKPLKEDTRDPLSSSTDSEDGMAPLVHSPEQPSETSTSENSQQTEISFLPALRAEGGALDRIAESAADYLEDCTDKSKITEQGRAIIRNFTIQMARGFVNAMPMLCRGKNCPFIKFCPLEQAKAPLPVGHACPVEMSMVQVWVNKHLIALGIKDVNEPQNSFDLDMLYEIAATELIRWRAAAHLSLNPPVVVESQIAATVQGDPIYGETISPALEIIELNTRLANRLKEALVATRKSQLEAGREMGDPSKKTSELVAKARKKAQQRLSLSREDIKDAEFQVKEKED